MDFESFQMDFKKSEMNFRTLEMDLQRIVKIFRDSFETFQGNL